MMLVNVDSGLYHIYCSPFHNVPTVWQHIRYLKFQSVESAPIGSTLSLVRPPRGLHVSTSDKTGTGCISDTLKQSMTSLEDSAKHAEGRPQSAYTLVTAVSMACREDL